MRRRVLKGLAIALLTFAIGSGATTIYHKLHPQFRVTETGQRKGQDSFLRWRNYQTPSGGNVFVFDSNFNPEAKAREAFEANPFVNKNPGDVIKVVEHSVTFNGDGKQTRESYHSIPTCRMALFHCKGEVNQQFKDTGDTRDYDK